MNQLVAKILKPSLMEVALVEKVTISNNPLKNISLFKIYLAADVLTDCTNPLQMGGCTQGGIPEEGSERSLGSERSIYCIIHFKIFLNL